MEELPDLPPRVPEELPELDRALQLLRAVCATGKLKDKLRIELETLLGGRVTQQLAKHWGTHLGEIRRDLAEELKREPAAEVQATAPAVAVAVAAVEPLPDLPPRVPEELAELDRALVLLNALRQAGKLKDKPRTELEALLGGRVTQQLAKHWGAHLGEIRRELAAELIRDPGE